MKDQQHESSTMSLIKSPKLFRKMFRSTEDIRHGKATPLFARRKKTGGKIYPKDDSNLKSPTELAAADDDGFFNSVGFQTTPRRGTTTSHRLTPQASIEEYCTPTPTTPTANMHFSLDRSALNRVDDNSFGNGGLSPTLPRIEGSDNENEAYCDTPSVQTGQEKKKKKGYKRFTRKYMRSSSKNSKNNNNNSSRLSPPTACQDDDKVYKTRSGKMKDKAIEISV